MRIDLSLAQAAHAPPLARGWPRWQEHRNRGTAWLPFLLRVPQPSGTPHPARIAVNRRQQASDDLIREDVPAPQQRDPLVERRYAGKPASQHDRIGIDEVDHRSQSARQPVQIAPESGATFGITTDGKGGDLEWAQALPAMAAMIRRERWPGKKSLDTARPAAIARRARDLTRGRPGQRVVAPFSGNGVGSEEDPSAVRDPPSDPGAEK